MYSTRIVLDVKEGPLISGALSIDNYGNRYTGQTEPRYSIYNNPTKIGDRLFSM